MYAVIRIRGTVNVSPDVKKTLEHLNLRRTNNLSLWPQTPANLTQLKSVEHMVTFGIIDDATLKTLIEKKGTALDGTLDAKKVLDALKNGKTPNQAGLVNCFTLNPPKKGYGRKGIKRTYAQGGANGDRKERIGELITRML